jgi:SRSO17 transposase
MSRWSEVLVEFQARIAHRFARAEVRERAGRYVFGLLDRVERKNGWQLAEAIGETGPQGVQRLLNVATWDADGVRDDLRAYVVDALGDLASGVLIVDETGFLKKGMHSCGVARQYTGTAGTMSNAQVGVFLTYASAQGAAFIDRALYLPRSWTQHPERRAAAHVPKGLHFATKLTLAQRMLARAFAARVPARWVTADSGYGRSHAFREWLEKHDRAYTVMIPKTTAVQYEGRRERAEQLGRRLSEEAWVIIATKDHAIPAHQWVCLPLCEPCAQGRRRWLLIRRPLGDPSDLAYYLAYGPELTPMAELVRVCDRRWAIEENFAEAKGEVGLDQYEVRTWTAWHRFITLCLLAHAALVVQRLRIMAQEASAYEATTQKGGPRRAASRRRCLKCAGWSWRCVSRARRGRSGSRGQAGDAPTRQTQPAATPRGGGQESMESDWPKLLLVRPSFPLPLCR